MRQTDGADKSSESRLTVAIALAARLSRLADITVPVWLDMPALTDLTGLSESSIRRMERRSEFPSLSQIGPRRRGLTLEAYVAWAQACQKRPSAFNN